MRLWPGAIAAPPLFRPARARGEVNRGPREVYLFLGNQIGRDAKGFCVPKFLDPVCRLLQEGERRFQPPSALLPRHVVAERIELPVWMSRSRGLPPDLAAVPLSHARPFGTENLDQCRIGRGLEEERQVGRPETIGPRPANLFPLLNVAEPISDCIARPPQDGYDRCPPSLATRLTPIACACRRRLSAWCFHSASELPLRGPWKQKRPQRVAWKSLVFLSKSGASEGIRTLDPNLGKVPHDLRWTATSFAMIRKRSLKQFVIERVARRICA